MNLPGFTAEASLYKVSRGYQARGTGGTATGQVIPQWTTLKWSSSIAHLLCYLNCYSNCMKTGQYQADWCDYFSKGCCYYGQTYHCF
jgi:hypothetical protein